MIGFFNSQWRSLLAPSVLAIVILAAGPVPAADRDDAHPAHTEIEPHAVILVYHHISDSTPASTSVTPARFAEHLDHLQSNGYQVLPLTQILAALFEPDNNNPLPDKAVAITFDDAYISVYEQAYPMLKERDMPFTLFVASKPLDEQWREFFSWNQLREMLANGADVGGHTHSHDYLARVKTGESQRLWRQRVVGEVELNIERIKDETQRDVTTFAYPYGESQPWIDQYIRSLTVYGLKQKSGAVGGHTQPSDIPRFPMAHGFDSLKRLSLALDSRPLPVINAATDDQQKVLRLSIAPGSYAAGQLNCFSSNGEALAVEFKNSLWTVELPNFKPGRNKINCTVPAADISGEFYWYSHQWLIPRPDGSYPAG
jgi:peptidoglycan/xylan/chitin deacetylase (PgdA/CDA1 family)